ncbi:MAG: LysR family transcriptional regulator [Gammaproteobacteria bacterium]|nr:MAG: LysR family transcriptional regulator [Gammaproteobacteria bacterium]
MDLELLRTFLELDRNRHFGRTAEALNLTQAAVSSRLQALERQLGVRLFERGRSGMQLTPEGGRLRRHAERIIAAWRMARQDVGGAEAAGQLVIGGSHRLWDVLLQRWLNALRRREAGLALIAEAAAPEHLVRRLLDGTMDVAVMLEAPQIDSLKVDEIGHLELALVATDAALDPAVALDNRFIEVDWGLSFGLDFRRAFPDAAVGMTRVSHARMALELLHANGGSAYLPLSMVNRELDIGLLYRVGDAPVFRRSVFASYAVRTARRESILQSLALISGIDGAGSPGN